MRCCVEYQGNCVGPVKERLNKPVCEFHGRLIDQLRNCTLQELENLCSIVTNRRDGFEAYYRHDADKARILALASDQAGFKANMPSVCAGTYDHAKHQ